MSTYFKKQKQKGPKPLIIPISKESISTGIVTNQNFEEYDYDEKSIPEDFLPKENDPIINIDNKTEQEYFVLARLKKFEKLDNRLKNKIYLSYYFSRLDEEQWSEQWLMVKKECEEFLNVYYTLYLAQIEEKINLVENSIDLYHMLNNKKELTPEFVLIYIS